MTQSALIKLLEEGLARLGLYLQGIELYLQYLALLDKWNKAYNLTAIRAVNDMVNLHILDSLAIVPWVQGKRVLDVGTGAGLPGIPLAIYNPEQTIVLLDSNGKKIRFLQAVQRELALPNIEIVQARVEHYHPSQHFDTIVSRAFSNLASFIQFTQHLRARDGIWLAMKGEDVSEELADLKGANLSYQIKTYSVTKKRSCVIVKATDLFKSK